MVIDTSAVIAIMFQERERDEFVEILAQATSVTIAAGSIYECAIVAAAKKRDPTGSQLVLEFVDDLAMDVEPFDSKAIRQACQAYLRFGRGYHPARLNYADCFSYALAKARDEPLLFKGDDFARTDIVPAWRPQG